MSKVKVELKSYEPGEVYKYTKSFIREYHNTLALHEKNTKRKQYDKFGEWKLQNPNNPMAKINYPDEEYVLVISAYKKFFDNTYNSKIAEIDF